MSFDWSPGGCCCGVPFDLYVLATGSDDAVIENLIDIADYPDNHSGVNGIWESSDFLAEIVPGDGGATISFTSGTTLAVGGKVYYTVSIANATPSSNDGRYLVRIDVDSESIDWSTKMSGSGTTWGYSKRLFPVEGGMFATETTFVDGDAYSYDNTGTESALTTGHPLGAGAIHSYTIPTSAGDWIAMRVASHEYPRCIGFRAYITNLECLDGVYTFNIELEVARGTIDFSTNPWGMSSASLVWSTTLGTFNVDLGTGTCDGLPAQAWADITGGTFLYHEVPYFTAYDERDGNYAFCFHYPDAPGTPTKFYCAVVENGNEVSNVQFSERYLDGFNPRQRMVNGGYCALAIAVCPDTYHVIAATYERSTNDYIYGIEKLNATAWADTVVDLTTTGAINPLEQTVSSTTFDEYIQAVSDNWAYVYFGSAYNDTAPDGRDWSAGSPAFSSGDINTWLVSASNGAIWEPDRVQTGTSLARKYAQLTAGIDMVQDDAHPAARTVQEYG